MRLLVSVRSAAEVGAALAGRADIIDAKEPSRGALGAVDPVTLEAIAGRLPDGVPLSIALGDFTSRAQVENTISRLSVRAAAGPVFLKLGFAGVTGATPVEELLESAVGTGESVDPRPMIVAVAYADHVRARAPSPATVVRAAALAGVGGVLLDTSVKNGLRLFDWFSPLALAEWIATVRSAGMLAAVAGSLREDDAPSIRAVAPDVVGVRGAACRGGREGMVDAARLRALRSALDGAVVRQRRAPDSAKREIRAPSKV